jgi:excinuclease ABC subunit C
VLFRSIKGNRVAVMREIEKEMKAAAKDRDYELAAKLRTQLYNLGELRRQIVFGRDEFLDISKDEALAGLRDLLGLPVVPRRIEAYDISHISGQHNTASMVVATNGVADKREYRKFKLRGGGNNDYAHMRETISRRLKHLRDWGRPDLVIIDGGAGQLGAVADLLRAEKIPFIGRNKSGDHTRNARVVIVVPKSTLQPPDRVDRERFSRVSSHGSSLTFSPSFKSLPSNESGDFITILLEHDSHVAKLIARLDDESHRFAVTYHRLLRGKSMTN